MGRQALTDRQRLFVEQYLGECRLNATRAAKAAGYEFPRQQGSRLLANVDVRTEIDARLDERSSTTNEILDHLKQVVDADLSQALVVDEQSGRLLGLDWNVIRELGPAIESIQWTAHGPKVKLASRLTALELLGKARRLFVDRAEVKIDEPFAGWTDEDLEEYARTGRNPGGAEG